MAKKILQFQTSIQDVKPLNYGLSQCSVRILYTGKNRNLSIITKDAVNKALPSITGIPIVGEFSREKDDWKGHGGKIDMDSYDFIHTTQPYGFVPADATYEWELVGGREYLTIHNCVLWTERYPEAYTVIEKAKGQSMEIEVNSGRWVEEEEAYQIDDFRFSALCILGDDVTPAFEDASIYAYSLSNDEFKKDYMEMLGKYEMAKKQKEGEEMILKELLAKYSTTMEELTKLGFNVNEVSEDELESKIVELLGLQGDPEPSNDPVDPEPSNDPVDPEPSNEPVDPPADPATDPANEPVDPPADPEPANDPANDPAVDPEPANDPAIDIEGMKADYEKQITDLNKEVTSLKSKLEVLEKFKLDTEKASHEEAAKNMFTNFQLSEKDVEDIDVHAFTIAELEDKCYAIIGKKFATKQNFSLDNQSNKLPINPNKKANEESPYGDWVENYRTKDE